MRASLIRVVSSLAVILSAGSASAASTEADLQGAWLEQGADCHATYTLSGGKAAFRKNANAFTPGFIISGSQLTTPLASCSVKTDKREGDRHLLTLSCTNAISTEGVTAIFSMGADGDLRRYLDASDTVGSRYRKCTAADLK